MNTPPLLTGQMKIRPAKQVDRTCGAVTPIGFEGIATVGTLSALKKLLRRCRTANENDMRLSAAICTANAAAEPEQYSELTAANAVTLPATPADGWYLITPLGEFPGPNGDRLQVFGAEEAREVVSTFNSIAGKASRYFKNAMSGRFGKWSVPMFEGHPDQDPARWRRMNLLGEIKDLASDAVGLWGHVTWNAAGLAARTVELGPLKPSAFFWHEAADAQGRVFPVLLESVGMVVAPNIRTAPTWTANALPGLLPDENQNQNQDMKHRDQLIALLGLKADADDAAIQSSLDAHGAKVTSTANALTEAASAQAQLETQLSTANAALTTEQGRVTALTTERDTLTTANATLTTANGVLVTGILDLAEKKGAITPAEREAYKGKLTTANSAAATLTELKDRKAMNVTHVEIGGSRVDLSTANARADVITTAVAKRMKDDACDHSTAYAKVKADPMFAAVFAAMADPTRKDS